MTTEMLVPETGELVAASETHIVEKVKAFMDGKEKKIMFNGKRYAEFEDWQYAAGFYGLTVQTLEPTFIEINEVKGFQAKANVVNKDGLIVGSAASFCMMDEPNWKLKPIFQLASMAQTRAGAKALSNIFRPLMRMAGVEGTPKEEMEGVDLKPQVQMPKAKAIIQEEAKETAIPALPEASQKGFASEKQRKMIFAKCRAAGISEDDLKAFLWNSFQIESTKDLKWQDIPKVLEFIDNEPKA